MSRWEITKHYSDNPTLLKRVYAFLFVAPMDILEPGYEWKRGIKGRYQNRICNHVSSDSGHKDKPKLKLIEGGVKT